MPQETRHQHDAVIVGGGLAGIAAALELLDHGRSVLILDRREEAVFGGQARESFGGVFMVDTPEQRRSGIRDNAELALSDWLHAAQFGPDDVWPRRWAEHYVHNSRPEVYDWLRARGVSFFPVVHWVERGYDVPGNSLPRFHMVWGTGEGLIKALVDRLQQHPRRDRLQLRFNHHVQRLLVEGGTVVGCAGVDEATGQPFEARGEALIVATGGINGDLARVRSNWHRPWGEPPESMLNGSLPTANGELHDCVAEQGGAITHLDKMWNYAAGVHHPAPRREGHGLSLVPPKSALWVDYQGRRIGPMALVAGYDTRYMVEQVCKQPRKYSWQILNWKIAAKELAVSGSEFNDAIRDRNLLAFLKTTLFGNSPLVRHLADRCVDFVTAQNVPELVAKMNALAGDDAVQEAVLADEIRRYDDQIRRGPAFHNDDQLRRIAHLRQYRGDRVRTCRFQPIEDPGAMPLLAIRLHILSRKSLGGIQTDLGSRVLSTGGEPIPGLYAVGEAAGFGGGGIHGLRTLEGTLLGSCILTGRAAGQSIVGGRA